MDGVRKLQRSDASILQAGLAEQHVVRQENLVSGLQFQRRAVTVVHFAVVIALMHYYADRVWRPSICLSVSLHTYIHYFITLKQRIKSAMLHGIGKPRTARQNVSSVRTIQTPRKALLEPETTL